MSLPLSWQCTSGTTSSNIPPLHAYVSTNEVSHLHILRCSTCCTSMLLVTLVDTQDGELEYWLEEIRCRDWVIVIDQRISEVDETSANCVKHSRPHSCQHLWHCRKTKRCMNHKKAMSLTCRNLQHNYTWEGRSGDNLQTPVHTCAPTMRSISSWWYTCSGGTGTSPPACGCVGSTRLQFVPSYMWRE